MDVLTAAPGSFYGYSIRHPGASFSDEDLRSH
jgi:hypothetical protein